MSPLPLIDPLLDWLDWAGMAVFALSGALVAAAKRQTLVTFFFFAVVTGIGGGTFRDLLIGAPVFWVHQNVTLLICMGAAMIVWLTPARIWNGQALLWLDAGGLAAYASFGAAKSLAFHVAPIPAIGMGVLSGCLGGMIRDVLAGDPSILMRPELYVTAAALSATLTVALVMTGAPPILAGLIAGAAGFALRGAAIRYHWSLPAYGR
jgi:uncharacterized membrane protein YeiH